jgi:hypothetical protein
MPGQCISAQVPVKVQVIAFEVISDASRRRLRDFLYDLLVHFVFGDKLPQDSGRQEMGLRHGRGTGPSAQVPKRPIDWILV